MPDSKLPRAAVVVIAVLVLAVAAALRIYRIDSDPPHGLSVSRAIYTDEGLKYYQARNRALFGQWGVDTPYAIQGHLRESPVPTVIGAAVFKAAGAGRVQARVISIASGVLTVLLLILIGVRAGESAVGLLAGAFAAVCFFLLSYDRLALFEAPAVMFSVAAAFCFLRRGRVRYVLSAALLATAYFTRAFSATVGVAFVLALACERWSRLPLTRVRRALVALAAVVAAVLVVVLVFRFFPESQLAVLVKSRFAGPFWQRYPLVPAALDLVVRAFSDSVLATWATLMLLPALLALAPAASEGADSRRPAFTFFWWFMMTFALVAFVDYRPSRYYVLMLPAVCYLAAWWIARLAAGAGRRRGAALALWTILRLFAGVHIAAVALRVLVAMRHELPLVFDIDSTGLSALQAFIEREFIGSLAAPPPADAVALAEAVRHMWLHAGNLLILGAAVTFVTGAWMVLRERLFPSGVPERARLLAAVALSVVIFAQQGARSYGFFGGLQRRYQVAYVESCILRHIGARGDAVIAGNWATTLAMGTPYFTLPFAQGNGNAWDTFKRFPVTHLLIELTYPEEIKYLVTTYPDQFKRMRRLEVFDIDFYKVAFYEYVGDPSAPVPPWPIGPAPRQIAPAPQSEPVPPAPALEATHD